MTIEIDIAPLELLIAEIRARRAPEKEWYLAPFPDRSLWTSRSKDRQQNIGVGITVNPANERPGMAFRINTRRVS